LIDQHLKIVRAYTGSIVTYKPDNIDIGTAIFLRVSSRRFVVTAKHNLESRFEIRDGNLSSKALKSNDIIKVIEHAVHDLAIIEIDDSLNTTFHDLSQLLLDIPKQLSLDDPEAPPAWLVGYPRDCVITTPPAKTFDELMRSNLKLSKTTLSVVFCNVQNEILSLRYPTQDKVVSVAPNGAQFSKAMLPESPKGFSGCGVWALCEPKRGQIFNPQHCIKLLGIQYDWTGCKSRIIHATSSKVIVRLLVENYPDLQDGIDMLFKTQY